MEKKFYIVFNVKSPLGFEPYGKFYLGNHRKFATELFEKLKGSPEMDEYTMLHLDFMETVNELPVNIKMLGCTLNDMAENCKTITKETFKFFNLGETWH